MSFSGLPFLQKSSTLALRHNSKYGSDILLTICTAALLDCLRQTYQIFTTAIFQGVFEDLIVSYDLISLFPSI